jgi:predicted transposase/invertase (TIGR01784 family)
MEPELESFVKNNEGAAQFVNRLRDYWAPDPEIRMAYMHWKLERLSRATERRGIEEELEQGIQKGIEQGYQKTKLAIAKNMLDKGLDIDMIARMTSLTKKQIKALR